MREEPCRVGYAHHRFARRSVVGTAHPTRREKEMNFVPVLPHLIENGTKFGLIRAASQTQRGTRERFEETDRSEFCTSGRGPAVQKSALSRAERYGAGRASPVVAQWRTARRRNGPVQKVRMARGIANRET